MQRIKNTKYLLRILHLFLPYKLQIVIILMIVLFNALISLVRPILNKQLIDDGILKNDFNLAIITLIIMFSIGMFAILSTIFRELIRIMLASKLSQQLYASIFDGLNRVNINYYNTKNSSEKYIHFQLGVDGILQMCDDNMFHIIFIFTTFIGGVIGLFVVDYRLAWIVLLIIPLKLSVVHISSRIREKLTEKFIQANCNFAEWFDDSIDGMREVRLFGIFDVIKRQMQEKIFQFTDSRRQLLKADTYNNAIDSFFFQLLEMTIYIVGVYFIFNDTMTLGSLFAFISYSVAVMSPITSLLNIKYMLANIIPSSRNYFEFIDYSKDNAEQSGIHIISLLKTIEFNSVNFGYDDNKNILNSVNFTINKGDRIAIVGNNGSGKSTLISLIEGFNQPRSGEVFINGINLCDCNIAEYRKLISCMNQNAYLFNVSPMNNIRLYENISDGDIENVVMKCAIEPELVMRKDNIGKNGIRLSGGQRQKIALARMLVRNKQLYIFDEPTSNIDFVSEKLFLDIINHIDNKKTIIMIAHKLNYLKYMNRILLVENNGAIREIKSLDELKNIYTKDINLLC